MCELVECFFYISDLKCLIVVYFCQLGHLNTPIHKWNLPGIPQDVELFIKRDDMTGSTLGGNKVVHSTTNKSTFREFCHQER